MSEENVKVTSAKFLPGRGVEPGDSFTVPRSEAAQLFANGLIEDPKIEGADGPTVYPGMTSPNAPVFQGLAGGEKVTPAGDVALGAALNVKQGASVPGPAVDTPPSPSAPPVAKTKTSTRKPRS